MSTDASIRIPDLCWYVAYGSNMDPAALRRYLPPEMPVADVRDVKLTHEVYFAGRSKTWGAAVAFLTLAEVSDASTHARAFLLPPAAFESFVRGENGIEVPAGVIEQALASLHPEKHAELDFEMDAEGYRGKYNALLRLQDIAGLPAYTLTTSRSLVRGEPAATYLHLITQAKHSTV